MLCHNQFDRRRQFDFGFREFALSDYDNAIALWMDTEGVQLRDADSKDSIAKYLARNPGLSFIAESDGQLIGTLMAGHDGRRGYLQHLAVAEQYRRMGIATELLTLALAALKAEGILKSHIHILAGNEHGKSYWQAQGWQKRSDIEIHSYINHADLNI